MGCDFSCQFHKMEIWIPFYGKKRTNELVASNRRGKRKPNARVAAGSLDECCSGPQHTPTLGVVDQRDAQPILDASAGVAHFELCHDASGHVLPHAFQPELGRTAACKLQRSGRMRRRSMM